MNKTMKIALVACGRRENIYAREWVEHHLMVGFHHIFIADNNHDGEEHFEDVLSDYIAKGKVTIIDYRNQIAIQRQAYADIYAKYQADYDWMAFFDFDEFLDIKHGDLQTFLTNRIGCVVLVNWQCYGDNGLVRYDDRPCWERFKKPLPHPLYVQYRSVPENDHIKSIVRGGMSSIEFNANPHVPKVYDPRGYETAGGQICKPSAFQPYDDKDAVLRHYITKTAEEWMWRSKRGSGSRSLAAWKRTYEGRFFKYNEFTQEKQDIMTKDRTVAIVHYNTPELTEATILSLRKHGGENYKVVIFDNSDERPWTKKMKNVKRIDNTKGQIIDFDKELAKFPNKWSRHGVNGKCVYGSDKHMMSIQALFDLLPDGFLLMDSDILLKQNVDFMFQDDQCVVGHIQEWQKSGNPYHIERIVPMLCYINVPLCRECGIDYWDPKRSWMLHGQTKASWYDTGASFLEDIKSHKNGAHGKRINIKSLMEHLKSGSWRNESQAKSWLEQHKDLWFTEPEKESKPKTAKRAISKKK